MPVNCHPRPPGAQRKSTSVDILTPPDLLVALGALRWSPRGGYRLGPEPFDLDPSASLGQPWPTARVMYTVRDDGMQQAWCGEAWLNAPYGTHLYAWLARLASHGDGLALLYARTDTAGFHAHVWSKADAVYFLEGRLWFCEPGSGRQLPHNCGGPMCLVAYGGKSVSRLGRLDRPGSAYPGALVHLK